MRTFVITVNGNSYEVNVEEIKEGDTVTVPKKQEAKKPAASAPKASGNGTPVNAPMPGTVLDIKVQNGAAVKKGDTLIILEAMKMENSICAPEDGTVNQVAVTKGATVNTGDLLVLIG